MKEERKVSPASRLGATYVTVRIILPVIAEILPLRVKVKPEWLRQVNDFSEVVEFLFPSAAPLPTSTSVIQSKLTTPKCIEVQIEGVPIRGIVDTGLFSVDLPSRRLLQ